MGRFAYSWRLEFQLLSLSPTLAGLLSQIYRLPTLSLSLSLAPESEVFELEGDGMSARDGIDFWQRGFRSDTQTLEANRACSPKAGLGQVARVEMRRSLSPSWGQQIQSLLT